MIRLHDLGFFGRKKLGDNKKWVLAAVTIIALAAFAPAQQYPLGFATGYPPYQFIENSNPAGLDIEIVTALGKYGFNAKIVQESWDDVVGKLRNNLGIDVVGGMEITEERSAQFDFTASLYNRKNGIFVPTGDTSIAKIGDLQGKIVAGDRGSYIEGQLAKLGIKSSVRLPQYDSKEASMQALKDGKVAAAIMPDAVGFYLAKKIGFAARMLSVGDPGSPVAFAVRKGDAATLGRLNSAIQKANAANALDPIISKWLK